MTSTYLYPVIEDGATIERVPIIDIRSTAACERKFVKGSMAMPPETYADRSLEMPPRKYRIALLVDSSEASQTLSRHMLKFLPDDIAAVVQDGDESFWRTLPEACIGSGSYPAAKQPRLWRPSPLMEVVVDKLSEWTGKPADAPVTCLDAGSGTGRNAVYLLQERPGVTVTAVDNRRAMLEKLAKFAERTGVSDRMQCKLQDIDAYVRDAVCSISPSPTTSSAVDAESAAAEPATGSDRGLESSAGAAPSSASRGFDVLLFMRFTHKPAIAQSLLLLDQQHGGLIIIDAFHVTTRHPSEREQQLEEGEASRIVVAGHASAAASPSADAASPQTPSESAARFANWHVETVYEKLGSAEDGRPMMHVVLRATPRRAS